MTATEGPPWPERPPGVPAFEHLELPAPPPAPPPADLGRPPPPAPALSLPMWVATVVGVLTAAAVLAAGIALVLVPARRSSSRAPATTTSTTRFTVRTLPTSTTVIPTLPRTIPMPMPPAAPGPEPAVPTPTSPGSSPPAPDKACTLVTDDEARSVLGVAVASRQAAASLPPYDLPGCTLWGGDPARPETARLLVMVGDNHDYDDVRAREPGAVTLQQGDDSFVADHPGTSPHSTAFGIVVHDVCVVMEVVGSQAAGGGIVPAGWALVNARARL